MKGFTRRADGKVRADFITSTATGRDTEPVRRVKQALGLTCPECGSERADRFGTPRRPARTCTHTFHGGAQ